MATKNNDLVLRSALAAIGISGFIGIDPANANSPFSLVDRTEDRILIAGDSGCGKGSCGTDEKGAADAKKAHSKKEKGKESSCKTGAGGKESSCKTSEKKSGEKSGK